MPMLKPNATHDPSLRSWVESANKTGAEFPIQNLPLGVFRVHGGQPEGGVALGDSVLRLQAALEAGLFADHAETAAKAAAGPSLNPIMALGPEYASALRTRLSD